MNCFRLGEMSFDARVRREREIEKLLEGRLLGEKN